MEKTIPLRETSSPSAAHGPMTVLQAMVVAPKFPEAGEPYTPVLDGAGPEGQRMKFARVYL